MQTPIYLLLLNLSSLLQLFSTRAASTPTPTYLNITAITTHNNASIFQCWQFLEPMHYPPPSTSPSSSPDQQLPLRLPLSSTNITNTNSTSQPLDPPLYQTLPPNYTVGLHTAPTLQYVFVLSGLVHLYLPNTITTTFTNNTGVPNETMVPENTENEVWMVGGRGRYGVILATDVKGEGHVTEMPGAEWTVTVQVPILGVPDYRVLYEGGCLKEELGVL